MLTVYVFTADCHFQHPPGRRQPGSFPYYQANKVANKSAIFGASAAAATPAANGATTATQGIAADPSTKEDESKMSARMQKFSEASQGGERIVAGQVSEEKKDDDLEVVM